jgi:hypothetical protein
MGSTAIKCENCPSTDAPYSLNGIAYYCAEHWEDFLSYEDWTEELS